jgi:hypothetical protein
MTVRWSAGRSLYFEGDGVVSVDGISKRLNETRIIHYEPAEVTLSIGNDQARMDSSLAFVHNISIGELGFHFVVDLVIGLTIAFRIEYQDRVTSFSQSSKFESDDVPITCLSDTDSLAATSSGTIVSLWYLPNGLLHRKLTFDAVVTAVAFDVPFSCLFIATERGCFYANVNGDVLCQVGVPGPSVSVALFLNDSLSYTKRVAICGTTNGELWFASPNFDLRSIDISSIPSEHSAKIISLTPHPSRGGVMSADADGLVCFWSCVGVQVPKLRPEMYRRCAACGGKPLVVCQKCNSALCQKCAHECNPGRCLGLRI